MIDPKWGKFRKKPVVIEAFQWSRALGCCIPQISVSTGGQYFIYTLEGTFGLTDDDWVIKGVKGEFYPCKPDIFEATYQPVTEVTDE